MTDIIKKENSQEIVNNKDYLTIEEIARINNVSKQYIYDAIDNNKLKYTYQKAKNGRDIKVIRNIDFIEFQQQQEQLKINNIDKQAQKLFESKDIEIIGTAFKKSLDNASAEDILQTSLYFMKMGLEKATEKNIELENKNKDLQDWKEERIYIENEKYKSKELRTKINRAIKKHCFNNKINYSDFTIKLYKLYDNVHCFTAKANYNGYLDIIEERGHLKEFYNIVLNNI